MSLKILVLGVNGFIGSALVEQVLAKTSWEIYGIDLQSHKIKDFLNHPRLHFRTTVPEFCCGIQECDEIRDQTTADQISTRGGISCDAPSPERPTRNP